MHTIYVALCTINVVGIYLCIPYDVALCTINVVGIYLCIPYDVALCTINVVGIYLCIPYMWLYVQSIPCGFMYNQCSWDISVHTI